jgi:DNA-binding transcriptional ArsR family regulator
MLRGPREVTAKPRTSRGSVADVFQVLADPTRRRIVEVLRRGERSVGEIVEAVDIGQPGVSRQLAILEDADFVVVRPDGRRRLYSLRPDPFRELSEFVTAYRTIWEPRLDRIAAELDRRRNKKKRSKE